MKPKAIANVLIPIGFTLIAVPAGLWGQATLSGLVLDQDGQAIPGATVIWSRADLTSPATVRAEDRSNWSGHALADNGSFSIENLPPGRYSMCAEGTAVEHLSSCVWNTTPQTLEITATDSASINLNISSGRVVKIIVADPRRHVTAETPFSVIAASAQGPFAHARRLPRAVGELEFAVAVPNNTEIRLIVDTPVKVRDALGQPVPTGIPSISVGPSQSKGDVVQLTVQ